MATHIARGNRAESLVAHSLEKHGFKVLERNYKQPFGEIDVIAQKDELLVFVEVKMRQKSYFDLAELITPSKQHKIIATAETYLAQHNYHDKTCRFDVALVEMHENEPKITYLADAFSG
jgi:uncharacterized protein (TIGR00252 family)